MKDVSGSFISSSGVGTQMTITSHSPAREKSVVASMSPSETISASSSEGTSGM